MSTGIQKEWNKRKRWIKPRATVAAAVLVTALAVLVGSSAGLNAANASYNSAEASLNAAKAVANLAAARKAPLGCDYTGGVLTCDIPQTTTTETATVTTPGPTVTEPGTTVTQTQTTTVVPTSDPTSTTSTTVSTISTPPTTTTSTPPSIWSAPVFTDDFATAKPAGFPGISSNGSSTDPKWSGYHYALGTTGQDTSKRGFYRQEQASVHDGSMDVYLQTINGQPRVFAPIPKLTPTSTWPLNGQLGGRYSVDVKISGAIPRYKQAFLLWPDSGVWADGELDFPEGEYDSTNNSVTAFSHAVLTNTTQNCSSNMYRYSPSDTPVNQTAKWGANTWHNYVEEWVPSNGNANDALNPGRWSLFVDGVLIHETTNPNCVPSKSMHWVLQIETAIGGAAPAAATTGHVYIDNVVIQKYVAP